jgi:hypothetical protein
MSSSSSQEMVSSSQVASVARRIQLTPMFQKRYNPNANCGFRIRIIVNAAEGMTEHVFRFLRHPADTTGVRADEFTGVCSAIDLEELPIGEPLTTANPQTFRAAEVDLVFESATRAQEAWELIQAEVNQLVHTLNEMDTLEAMASVWLEGVV